MFKISIIFIEDDENVDFKSITAPQFEKMLKILEQYLFKISIIFNKDDGNDHF